MKNSKQKNQKLFQGAGFIISFLIALVFAILAYILSVNLMVALSTSLPIGITLGIGLEERFRGNHTPLHPNFIKGLFGLLGVGVMVFVVFFFLVLYF